MKTNSIINGLAACLIAISITACDKAKETVSDAASQVTNAAAKGMDAAKDAATAAMTNAVAAVEGPAGEAIAAAKKALDEKNYQGALDSLKKLEGMQLPPDVQKVVDGLKEQATKLLSGATAAATDATGAAAAALPK